MSNTKDAEMRGSRNKMHERDLVYYCLFASLCSFIEEQTTSALRAHPMARRQDFKFDPLCSAHLQTLRSLNADATTSLKEIQIHPIHHFRFKALFMTLKKFQTTASAELTTKCFHEHNC